MRPELEKSLQEIDQVMTILRRHLDWDKANARLLELNVLAEDPTLWNDSQGAQKVMRERDQLATAVKRIQDLDAEVEEVKTLLQLGEEAGDDSLLKEGEESLNVLHAKCQRLRLESLLSGEADGNDCFVEIHAGAGGTEAQDWALILQRLYVRWAERRNFKLEWIEENAGDEAGIQSCTFKVMGHQAYGWLKTESGVHRLVRISPFDSNAKRHTSFASIWVYPVIDDNIDIVIEDKDIRIDTYRASGAGGQHVNKTDSAVRITHIPTNIVVQCQNDRSQHRNKAQCMSMLKARLYEREMQLREAQSTAEAAAKSAIGWGNQIRSYVLHPYQMVKDMRTGVEMGNTQAVLDGDIDRFLEASLTQRVGEKA